MDENITNTGAVTGTNEQATDVGGGDAGINNRLDDASNQPWHKDPRYREFHAEYKDWKANKDAYRSAAQELEQWRKGEHPSEVAWAAQIRDLVIEEYRGEIEKELAEAGLLDAYKRMKEGKPVAQDDKKDVNEIVREEITKFKSEFTAQQEAQRINETLTTQFQTAIGASPYKGVKGFQEKCLTFVKEAILRDHQTTGKYRPVAEYVAEVEQMFDEAYPTIQQRRTAKPAAKTLAGAGATAGMSRREQLEQQKAAILAQMRDSRQ